jgi:hypothetical protein
LLLGLGLWLRLLLTAAAVAASTAIGARAALVILAPVRSILPLANPAPDAAGLGHGPAHQRQDHRGRDQTFHFVLQGPLCWTQRSSLLWSVGLAP